MAFRANEKLILRKKEIILYVWGINKDFFKNAYKKDSPK